MAQILTPQAGGNPNAIVVRIKGRNAKNVNGQRRHDLRMGNQPAYVNVELTSKNRVLISPWTGSQLKKESIKRRNIQPRERAIKSNAGIAIVGLIAFGSNAQKRFERLSKRKQDEAFLEIAEAIAAKLKTTLTGLVVHMDETAPHAHFQLVGYDLKGNSVAQETQKRHTSALQDLAAKIIKTYEPKIERGRKIKERIEAGALPHETVHRQVNVLHRDLPDEIAQRTAELDELNKRIEKNKKLIARSEARENRSKKQAKNLDIYKRRLADKEADLEERTAVLSALERTVTELETRQRKAERAADYAERRAQKAQEVEKYAWEAYDRAELKVSEAEARTPIVLEHNHIDDLPIKLKTAIDLSANDRGFIQLRHMDEEEKLASARGFLRDYVYQVATTVYHEMAKTTTALRRRLRAALQREKETQVEISDLKKGNAELERENGTLRERLSDLRNQIAKFTTRDSNGPEL